MFKHLADKSANLLVSHKIIKEEKQEEYSYGLELVYEQVTFYIAILIIALITKTLLFSFLFVVLYKLLRQYTGGFHCKTASMCLFLSVIIYISAMLVFISDFDLFRCIFGWSAFISTIIILIFSPIENINHPVDVLEKKKYKLISIVSSIIIILLTAVSYVFNVSVIFYSTSCSLTADAILIIFSLRRCKDDTGNVDGIGCDG